MKNIILFVYGTLRPNTTPPVQIPGFMYDLGHFPGVKLKTSDCGCVFNAEKLEINAATLNRFDHYEGYNPHDPEGSLYIRKTFEDGYIYEYNHNIGNYPRVRSGDWPSYRLAMGEKYRPTLTV